MIKQLIYIVFFVFISSMLLATHVEWNNPVFINNSDLAINKISFSTKAQGKAFSVDFKNKNEVLMSKQSDNARLNGKLGGEFSVDSIDFEKHKTIWKIRIEGMNSKENFIHLKGDYSFCNEFSDGPALSMWPNFLTKTDNDKSYLLLYYSKKKGKYFLLAHIDAENGKNYINYKFSLHCSSGTDFNKANI